MELRQVMQESIDAGDRIIKGLPNLSQLGHKISKAISLPIISHIIKFQEDQSKKEILLNKTMKRIDHLVKQSRTSGI